MVVTTKGYAKVAVMETLTVVSLETAKDYAKVSWRVHVKVFAMGTLMGVSWLDCR